MTSSEPNARVVGATSVTMVSEKEKHELEVERDRILHEGPAPGKKGISPKEILLGICIFCLFGFFMWLAMNGYVQAAAVWAGNLGPVGHLIFVGLYIFVAMPFGWGYSIVIVAGGYVFGLTGIATAEVGTLIGAFLGYYLCRVAMADWVRAKLKGMKPKTQKTLLAIELAIRQGKGGIGMQTGLRVNPVLPYGWTNAVLGIWEVAPSSFVLSTMVGCQVDIILKTNLGIIFKTAGSLESQTPETKKLVQTQLYIQCAVFLVVLVAGVFYSRWIMKNVMPQGDEPLADPQKDNLTIETGNAEVVMHDHSDLTGEEQVRQLAAQMYVGGIRSRQGWRQFITILFRTRGSVLTKAIPVSIMSSIIAFAMVFWRTRDPDFWLLPELGHPFVVQVFGIILSFVVVARCNVALDRYFDGVEHVHRMSSRWIDAFTSLLGFLRSSYDLHPADSPKKEACVALGLAMLHWSTLAHAVAVNVLQCTQLGVDEAIWEPRISVLEPPTAASLDKQAAGATGGKRTSASGRTDRARSRASLMKGAMIAERRVSLTQSEGLDGRVGIEKENTKARRDLVRLGVFGQPTPDEVKSLHGATDKVAIILMWMEEAISRAQVQSILLTAPPILARVYNELGSGLAGFNSAYRISLVPFPFCFAQMIGWCLVVFLFLCPAVAFVFTGGEILTSSLTFCCLMGFWGLNRLAMELENPFGCKVNHLPLAEMHHAFVEALAEMHAHPMPEYKWQTKGGASQALPQLRRNLAGGK
eukprot:gnl/MRDRNA2_/MRDRNA2_67079_c0_seq1.p1 gnl/MRDRNA2_/MRDRNA2_67079_c0~~gnl/MRDRNA2_/MRDRNA2_67079_c0_seq1.p1  ORF type:complete len:753 (+),score=119.52 gnl/MRDRNA2_/MRDRNA2_67079_c0_seq1:136-2394(+)